MLKFKYHLNAFTLLEMLFSLSLLSIAFIVILTILEINFRILDRNFTGDTNADESYSLALLTRTLETIFNKSHSIEEVSRNLYLVHSFNNNFYRFRIEGKSFFIEQIHDLNKTERLFTFQNASILQTEIKKAGGRTGFCLKIEGKNYKTERWYISGYLKRDLYKTNASGAEL